MRAFFALHRALPREGPGEAADVHWALAQLDDPPMRVADLACGPGADLETLAVALPDAQLTGIDRQAHFVDAARERTKGFGERVQVRVDDMATPGGTFDLIWCAGAVYFMGIIAALTAWKPNLAQAGAVAFSEPVLLRTPASGAAMAFWGDEDIDLTDAAGIAARVTAAGFRTRATRLIIGAPWRAYYAPMDARIAALRVGADAELAAVLDAAAQEVALWRAAPEEIAYLLSVVEPVSCG